MEYKGIIVGLGNPGAQYMRTRHNLGFDCLDVVLDRAQESGRCESLNGGKFKCELWRCTLGSGREWWLAAKPQTFMNLSGDSVQPLMAWHKLSAKQLIVLHDELDITPGCLRFKFGGGNAGHNGLKSITQQLGTPDFYRLRLGIGRPPHKGDVTGWVLGRPDSDAAENIRRALHESINILDIYIKDGLQQASKRALSFVAEST